MSIYVNRILNMKKIKAIGLDMDHTIVRYSSEKFESLTYHEMVRKLVALKNYPSQIQEIPFDFKRAIRGLVIDRRYGNLVKLSLYGRVKQASHGAQMLDYNTMNKYYQGMVIDLIDPNFRCIDTTFSIGEAILYSNLVDFKDNNLQIKMPNYEELAMDIQEVLDLSHRDGSLKGVVAKNMAEYIIQDPDIPKALEKFKLSGKTLIIITNSDFHYSKLLLDYTFNPFLQHHKNWMDLFDYVITLADKPLFFTQKRKFLQVRPEDGSMTNFYSPLQKGIYQGGSSSFLQQSLNLTGEEILYIGDHIYGDILQLKKICHWRTALVMEEMEDETRSLTLASGLIKQLNELMEKKEQLEVVLNRDIENKESSKKIDRELEEIKKLNELLSQLIEKYQGHFNPYWGEVMRAGQEESRFMGQVAKYACIYMSKISDFNNYTSRHYYRPKRRPLPHE